MVNELADRVVELDRRCSAELLQRMLGNQLDSSDGSPLEQPAESQEAGHADAQERDRCRLWDSGHGNGKRARRSGRYSCERCVRKIDRARGASVERENYAPGIRRVERYFDLVRKWLRVHYAREPNRTYGRDGPNWINARDIRDFHIRRCPAVANGKRRSGNHRSRLAWRGKCNASKQASRYGQKKRSLRH
jgi:hypothetical protein